MRFKWVRLHLQPYLFKLRPNLTQFDISATSLCLGVHLSHFIRRIISDTEFSKLEGKTTAKIFGNYCFVLRKWTRQIFVW